MRADRSDLHALLAELEASGLVSRRPDERARRHNVVSLTAAGATMLARLERRVQAAQQALLAPLDEAGREALANVLARLRDTTT